MKEYIDRIELNKIFDEVCSNEVLRKQIGLYVDSMPVADVREVVHAKWESIEPYTAINGQYLKAQVCSNCDALFVSGGNEPYNNYPYCCVCGAKMDL